MTDWTGEEYHKSVADIIWKLEKIGEWGRRKVSTEEQIIVISEDESTSSFKSGETRRGDSPWHRFMRDEVGSRKS